MSRPLATLASASGRLQRMQVHRSEGTVLRVVGLAVESLGPPCAVGEECLLLDPSGEVLSRACVVGFDKDRVYSMPIDKLDGIAVGARVVALGRLPTIAVGEGMLGRVLNADGNLLSGPGPYEPETVYPLETGAPAAMNRERITEPFVTGIRALDGMITLGRGQRVGIFAGSGVGKSVLMGMIARHTRADVAVISLVGERGREVRDFIENDLGPEGLAHSVVFVATSDEPPMRRIRCALAATATAEYFRDRGAHVVLLMDSVTRVAMAQREVGLSMGEPPSTKGYPPSTFSLLPRMLERAGYVQGSGSITGIYTVYTEADDLNDPIADAARSLLDGHILLSRDLADRGHYPAIDVLGSISRLMPQVTSPEHQVACKTLRSRLAAYRETEDLILLGAYREGSNAEVDAAVRSREATQAFLTQGQNEGAAIEETLGMLAEAITSGHGEAAP